MKRIGVLIPLLLTIFTLIGISAYLFNAQTRLTESISVQETAQAETQSTLVAVFDERRNAEATLSAEIDRLEVENDQLSLDIGQLEPLATEVVELRNAPTPTPFLSEIDDDAPPQIRVTLRELETVWPVNEPVDIIVSAAHPIGIAAINVAINGETLLSESPFDPKLNISTTRWTPLLPGEYTITAIATTIRGRTTDPVQLILTVVDTSDPSALNESILRRIESNVEELRGLESQAPVEMSFLTPRELSATIEDQLLGDYTPAEAEREVYVLSMFDFIPDDYPLYENTVRGLSQAIAGYYDPEEDRIYVINADDEIDLEEKLTHAHEYMHALQDQYFTIARIQDDDLTRDERLALRSVGEGEAVLIEFLYQTRGYLTGEQNSVTDPVFPTPEAQNISDFYLSDFQFPYVTGYDFVNRYYQIGGFERLNELWENLPVSVEQILHPERYDAGDMPIPVALPDLDLDDSWVVLEEGVFGEFYIREYLSRVILDEAKIDTAATGWGGDAYVVHRNEASGERILVFGLTWDTPADADEFEAVYLEWAEERMTAVSVEQDGNRSCWNRLGDQLCFIAGEEVQWIVRTKSLETQSVVLDTIDR